MPRALRILALAGVAYVLWEYLKDTMGDKGPNRPAAPVAGGPQRPPQAGTGPATAGAAPAAESASASGSASAPASAPTSEPEDEQDSPTAGSAGEGLAKAKLYERATELGIKGRSSMNKAELERAIRDAS